MSYTRKSGAAWQVHPGEILNEEFMGPLDISGYALAKALGVNPQRVSDVILEKTGLSAEMALLLAKYFGTTPEFWMNLQSSYELSLAQKQTRRKLAKVTPLRKLA